jgi:hypothetical protein
LHEFLQSASGQRGLLQKSSVMQPERVKTQVMPKLAKESIFVNATVCPPRLPQGTNGARIPVRTYPNRGKPKFKVPPAYLAGKCIAIFFDRGHTIAYSTSFKFHSSPHDGGLIRA